MERSLTEQETTFLKKVEKLEASNPNAVKNLEFLIDGILLGMNLNKDKRKGE